MKRTIIGSAALLAAFAGNALAACPPSGNADATQIAALVEGRYACAVAAGKRWNELHSAGTVTDYKRGPTHPVDPSKVVGSYTIEAGPPATITYDYGGGGSYSYCISPAGTAPGTYGFFNASTSDVFRVIIQDTPCAFP